MFKIMILVILSLIDNPLMSNIYAEKTYYVANPQEIHALKEKADHGDPITALLLAEFYDQCEHTFKHLSYSHECPERLPANIQQNFELAAHYYQIAADYGIPYAQFGLGKMYAAGDYFEQSNLEAAVWISLAYELLPTGEEGDLVFIEREKLFKILTPAQIREVKQRVRTWKAKTPPYFTE